MTQNKTLAGKIIIFLLLGNILLSTVAGFWIMGEMRTQNEGNLRRQIDNLVNRMSLSLVTPMWEFNDRLLFNIIESEMNEPSFLGIVIISSYKNSIVAMKKQNTPLMAPISDPKKWKDEFSQYYLSLRRTLFRGDDNLGDVIFFFTDQAFQQDLNQLMGRLLLFILFFFALNAFLLYMGLKYLILNPLAILREGVGAFSQDLNKRIHLDSKDELGALANAFNTMAQDMGTSFTNQKRLFDEVNYLKNYLSNIIDSMPSVLIAANQKGVITQWNHAATVFSGVSSEQALLHEIWTLLPQLEPFKKQIHKLSKASEPLSFYRRQLSLNTSRNYDLFFYPISWENEMGFVVRIDDVTNQEALEDRLRQAEKMETVGNLAGGLAHDFNNILGSLVGTISLTRFLIESDKTIDLKLLQEYLEIMEFSTNRATNLVKQLLTLAKKNDISFQVINLSHIIKNVIVIYKSTKDNSIQIQTDIKAEEPFVLGDSVQLEQIILNLCINAGHAMTIMRESENEWGGVLKIELECRTTDNVFRTHHPNAKNSEYYFLRVMDTGIGIDSNQLEKIFDPFYTTKEKGFGTGLGLSLVYNTLQVHNAFIEVESTKGTGTCFTLIFPKSSQSTESGDV